MSVLFTLMSYLLFNPVRRMLEDRRNRIDNDIAVAEADKREAAAAKATYKTRLDNVEKEAEEILSEARRKARKNETRIVEEAREEGARIMQRAREEVALERKRALDEMKREMIVIASLMAGKVVASSIDTTIQDALVEETLKEIGGSTWHG